MAFATSAPRSIADAADVVSAYAREDYERRFILANAEYTLLHELAHVLIWELKLPVFGREEDAADTIAIMAQMMIAQRAGEDNDVEKLQSVANGWKMEWQMIQEDELENAYWDMHSLEIQRFYNIACLVYGADPARRGDILKAAQLPTDRAEWCHEEYSLAKRAMEWLLDDLGADPEKSASKQGGKVTVTYARNTTLEGEMIDGWLRDSQIAEKLALALTRRFRLPRDILISFESCPFPNAAWDAKTASITFCHSLLNRFLYLAREIKKNDAESADAIDWRASASH